MCVWGCRVVEFTSNISDVWAREKCVSRERGSVLVPLSLVCKSDSLGDGRLYSLLAIVLTRSGAWHLHLLSHLK